MNSGAFVGHSPTRFWAFAPVVRCGLRLAELHLRFVAPKTHSNSASKWKHAVLRRCGKCRRQGEKQNHEAAFHGGTLRCDVCEWKFFLRFKTCGGTQSARDRAFLNALGILIGALFGLAARSRFRLGAQNFFSRPRSGRSPSLRAAARL